MLCRFELFCFPPSHLNSVFLIIILLQTEYDVLRTTTASPKICMHNKEINLFDYTIDTLIYVSSYHIHE